jgi:hypothetical protein
MDDDDLCALVGTTATCWPVGGAAHVVPTPVTSIRLSCDARVGISPEGEIIYDPADCGPHPWNMYLAPASPGPWAQVELSESGWSLCALRSSGEFQCWGYTYDHTIRPAGEPPAGTRFADIAVGGTYVCGVTLDGHVLCWGVDPPMPPQAPNGYGMLDVPPELR